MRSLAVVAVLALVAAAGAAPLPQVQWPGIGVIQSGGTGPGPSSGAAARAVRAAVPTLTASQMRQLATGGVQRGVRIPVAGYVLGSSVLFGAALIPAALHWFYDQAQQATGTDLDGWWGGQSSGGTVPVPEWTHPNTDPLGSRQEPDNTGAVASATGGYTVAYRRYNTFPFRANAGVWHVSTASFVSGYVVQATENVCGQSVWSERRACIAAVADAELVRWLDDMGMAHVTPSQPLYDFLVQNPGHEAALRHVLEQYVQQHVLETGDPYTFEQPWENVDITFLPSLNWNTWTGSPYTDATVDTDGDGWPDWAEARLGTDWTGQTSRPVAGSDPDRDGFTNEQEVAAVTDPLDPTSQPTTGEPAFDAEAPASEGTATDMADAILELQRQIAELAQIVATEALQAAQLEAAQEQLALLEAQLAELEALRDILEAEIAVPGMAAPSLAETTDGPWTALQSQVSTAIDGLVTTAQTRLPFALGQYVPTAPTLGASSCPGVNMPILGHSQAVGLCDTPVHDFMSGTGRAVLLALAVIAFGLGAAALVAKS